MIRNVLIKNDKGITLAEVFFAIAICALTLMVLFSNIIIQKNFQKSIKDNTDISREGQIGIDHMARIMRFAVPATITTTGTTAIEFQVPAGNINYITSDTWVKYSYNSTNHTLSYIVNSKSGSPSSNVIVRNVNAFSVSWDGSVYINIEMVVSQGAAPWIRYFPLETRVRVLN